MLKQIRIQNLALIESVTIDFPAGFSAVTGETGAGKSVFLTGLRLCAGAKANAQMVRSGCEKALAECIYQISHLPQVLEWLTAKEIDTEEGEIEIQREGLANGKNRARINGSHVTQSDLAELGEMLLQMHGQSEQVILRDVRVHLQMLDAFAGATELLSTWNSAWKTHQSLLHEEADLRKQAADLAAKKEFLQFQRDELDKANLQAQEETLIEQRLAEAQNAVSKRKAIEDCLEILDGQVDIQTQISQLEKNISSLFRDQDSDGWLKQIAEANILFRELERTLKSMERQAGVSPQELERDNARLAVLQKLQRKYRTNHEGLIALRDRRRAELAALDNLDGNLADMEVKLKKSRQYCEAIAQKLRNVREIAGKKLDQAVERQLHQLGMAKAVFTTQIIPKELSAQGTEQIEFLIAPNAGEGLKTLKQAVSGGELSRVLLAFKSVLAAQDATPVLVFDEVDSGISGEVANQIGECLRILGKSHQVLTITHLHQVASCAETQICVKKSENLGRTSTQINILDFDNRIQEIARMLGDPDSVSGRSHAKILLESKHGR